MKLPRNTVLILWCIAAIMMVIISFLVREVTSYPFVCYKQFVASTIQLQHALGFLDESLRKVVHVRIDFGTGAVIITDGDTVLRILRGLTDTLLDFQTEHIPRPGLLTVHDIRGNERTLRIGYDPQRRYVYLPHKLCSRELFKAIQPYLSPEKSNAQPGGEAVSSSQKED
jgi:hypothetical protein